MNYNGFNQASSREQEYARLVRLHERMTEASLRSYNQPGANESHTSPYDQVQSHQVQGLRLSLSSGEYVFGLGAGNHFGEDWVTMAWGSRSGADGRLTFSTWKDPDTGDFRSRVLIEREEDGWVKPEEISDPLIVAAVSEYANTSLDALEQLAVPSQS